MLLERTMDGHPELEVEVIPFDLKSYDRMPVNVKRTELTGAHLRL